MTCYYLHIQEPNKFEEISQNIIDITLAIGGNECSIKEIMEQLGLKHHPNFLKLYLTNSHNQWKFCPNTLPRFTTPYTTKISFNEQRAIAAKPIEREITSHEGYTIQHISLKTTQAIITHIRLQKQKGYFNTQKNEFFNLIS